MKYDYWKLRMHICMVYFVFLSTQQLLQCQSHLQIERYNTSLDVHTDTSSKTRHFKETRKMAEFLIGEWKNFEFKLATPDMFPKLLVHLRKSFYKDEPLCKYVGYTEDLGDNIDKYVLYHLNKNEGLSFYAEEKGTGKIAGGRITCIKRKSDPEPDIPITNPNLLRIIAVLDEVGHHTDIFKAYNVEHYAYFVMTCVDPDFRGQGLVTEIYKRSLAMLKGMGFPVCSGLFTSPFTRKAAANLNFDKLYIKNFADFKDEKGEKLLPEAPDSPNDACSLMVLKFN